MLAISIFIILVVHSFLSCYAQSQQKDVFTVVLITGCSSGIGKRSALEFANNPNYKVWATMRSISKWNETPRDNVRVAELDVTSAESINAVIAQVLSEDGKIDIVVNNAGYGIAGTIEQVSIDDAKSLFDVNVWGPVRLLQAVLPYMRSRRSGHVINISSTSGIRGIPCFEFYTGSKFALEGIMDSMRYSLAAFNISVTNVNAGPVRTSFTDRFGNSELGGKGTRSVNDPTGYLSSFANRMILGLNKRMESPEAQTVENVARLIVNIAIIRTTAKRLTDVPFNIGSSYDSQKLLEEVRVQPTGWGGIYSDIFGSLPPLPPSPPVRQREEL